MAFVRPTRSRTMSEQHAENTLYWMTVARKTMAAAGEEYEKLRCWFLTVVPMMLRVVYSGNLRASLARKFLSANSISDRRRGWIGNVLDCRLRCGGVARSLRRYAPVSPTACSILIDPECVPAWRFVSCMAAPASKLHRSVTLPITSGSPM